MSLLNVISVPTYSGVKTIEIHNDDLTKLRWNVDILVLSAYHKSYKATGKSVIKSLESNYQVSLSELSKKPLFDFRESLHCWISQPLLNKNIKYVLCVEGIRYSISKSGSGDSAILDMFGTISMLAYKGINVNTIAMPLLGAGIQQNSIESILPGLINNSVVALKNISGLNTIYFVEKDATKAKLIDATINSVLKRHKDQLELVLEDPHVYKLLEEILSKLLQIKERYKNLSENKTLNDYIVKIAQRELRFFEMGILSRKLLELLLSDMTRLKSEKSVSLFEHLNDLKTKNIAEWMLTYMHTIRVFGNYVAHDNNSEEIPEKMETKDMLFFAQALNRFLDFYFSFKHKNLDAEISDL